MSETTCRASRETSKEYYTLDLSEKLAKMEVHPGMSYYNDVQDGTALITKTMETSNDLTPLHIPPGPPIHPDRYEELRETFQLLKPVLKAGEEYGGSEPILPESHRIYEPPYKFDTKHRYYGSTQDAPPRLPDVPENTAEHVKYPKHHTRGTLLVEGRYRPFHPYVHGNIDIRGSPERKEDPSDVLTINRGDTEWPGQHGAFHFGEGNGPGHEPQASRTMAPKSAVKPPELDISPRAANMLENVKKALWLSTYKRDYTGRGSMNPLLLDDYNAKVIGRTTGELGKDAELRESFPSDTSQVRPLEGRIARSLQGRECHSAHPQQQHSVEIHRIPLQCTDKPVIHAPNARQMSLSTFPQCPTTENEVKKTVEYLLQNRNCPQSFYLEENNQGKVLPFRKITDTWKIEKLYQRQLVVPPEPVMLLKSADSIYYEDLKPSRFNNYIVWDHPVSFSKPASLDPSSGKQCDVPTIQPASKTKDVVITSGFPKWIPNCGVPQPQTKLLDIQDSFRKGEAIKRLSDLTRGGIRDLRDHDRQGRRHNFLGTNAFFFS